MSGNKRAGDSGLSGALKRYGSHGDDPEFDDWGPVIQSREVKENGKVIGVIEDSYGYDEDDVLIPMTKQEAIQYVRSMWPEDEDHVDEDTGMMFVYADGTTRSIYAGAVDGVFKNKKLKPLSTKGLIGISYSDADTVLAWGQEFHRGERVPLTSEVPRTRAGAGQDETLTVRNAKTGVRNVGRYHIRYYTPYYPTDDTGGLKVQNASKRRVIRKSKAQKYSD